jgi:hypothetical protein
MGPRRHGPLSDRAYPNMIEEVRFARDSPLEETVLSELVSEPKFPGNRQKYRDFHRRSLRIRLVARNPEPNSVIYDPIPYASEQGSYFGLAGN